MKNELRQQAKDLYFQSGLTKTEIAERLGINRRTIMVWCQEGNWSRLRQSARHLPSLVAEKCYYLLNDYTSKFLDGYNVSNFNEKHADAINKLATAIKKLKNRSTSNESMELLNYFMTSVKRKDPTLADQILPHVEDYLASRKGYNVEDNLLEEFDEEGNLPYPTKEIDDKMQDHRDADAFREELRKADNDYDLARENWLNTPSVPPTYDPSYFAPPPAPDPNAGYPLSRPQPVKQWTPSTPVETGCSPSPDNMDEHNTDKRSPSPDNMGEHSTDARSPSPGNMGEHNTDKRSPSPDNTDVRKNKDHPASCPPDALELSDLTTNSFLNHDPDDDDFTAPLLVPA